MRAIDTALTALLRDTVIAAGAVEMHTPDAPHGAVEPYVVFREQAGTSAGVMHNRVSQPANYVYFFDVIDKGENRETAEAIADAIFEALHMQTLLVPGRTSLPVFWMSNLNRVETVKGGSKIQHVGKMYRIRVTP